MKSKLNRTIRYRRKLYITVESNPNKPRHRVLKTIMEITNGKLLMTSMDQIFLITITFVLMKIKPL